MNMIALNITKPSPGFGWITVTYTLYLFWPMSPKGECEQIIIYNLHYNDTKASPTTPITVSTRMQGSSRAGRPRPPPTGGTRHSRKIKKIKIKKTI
jgi:hypothetical protein